MRIVKKLLLAFLLLVATPLALHGAVYWSEPQARSWSTADWSSAGLLPPADEHSQAMVRIYSARTGAWKGMFATHSWIVLKEQNAAAYERWDKVGWGTPIRRNHRAPDARWYGHDPVVVFAADGAEAEKLIPRLRAGIEAYRYRDAGDYRVWPGPNSNTFVAAVLAAVPEIRTTLPPTAIGKDFPWDGNWFGTTPSETGFRLSLGGYAGLTAGWIEGIEFNLLGAVIGVDIRRPGIKLPGFGRIGV